MIMRSQTVKVADKDVVVRERKVSELKDLYEKNKPEIEKILAANKLEDGEKAIGTILYDKLIEIFPVLTAEDIDNAYPSQLEELVEAFVAVNFTGVKKIASPLMSLILTGLRR